MLRINCTRRVKIFLAHLAVSSAIFLGVLYFIILQWYPQPHFAVTGGWHGVRILVFVFFFLGPFLTLIVFRPLKSSRALAFDMGCIIILQIGAFIWGMHVIHSQRPVGIALYEGVIYPVLEADLIPQKKTPADLQRLDEGRPPVVYAHAAVDEKEQVSAAMYEITSGLPESKLLFLMEPIKNNVDKLFAASLEKTKTPVAQFSHIRDDYLKQHHLREGDVAFVPFAGRYGSSLLVFDHSARIIDSIPDPRETGTSANDGFLATTAHIIQGYWPLYFSAAGHIMKRYWHKYF